MGHQRILFFSCTFASHQVSSKRVNFVCVLLSHIIVIMLDVSSMERYVSPINPAVFPHLTVVLMGIGIFFMAWFFVYEVTASKFGRSLKKELVTSLVASVFMGFGVLFLLLWVGIYV